jgi:hypothetical protein
VAPGEYRNEGKECQTLSRATCRSFGALADSVFTAVGVTKLKRSTGWHAPLSLRFAQGRARTGRTKASALHNSPESPVTG